MFLGVFGVDHESDIKLSCSIFGLAYYAKDISTASAPLDLGYLEDI